MQRASEVLGSLQFTLDKGFVDDHLAVTFVRSLLCQVSTCFRIGSKFRCMRSTPTEMQSMSEKDFESLATTGVKSRLKANPETAPRKTLRLSYQ